MKPWNVAAAVVVVEAVAVVEAAEEGAVSNLYFC